MAFWEKKEKKKSQDPFDMFFGDDFSKIMNKMMGEMQRSFEQMEVNEAEINKIGPNKSMVYGFSMKMGPDGKMKVEEFGNVEPAKKQVREEREPLADIIEKENVITATVEMPGVEKNDIDLELEDDNHKLVIKAPNKYYKELHLPARVKADVSKATYKNGVLEIELTKTADSKKRTKINVE